MTVQSSAGIHTGLIVVPVSDFVRHSLNFGSSDLPQLKRRFPGYLSSIPYSESLVNFRLSSCGSKLTCFEVLRYAYCNL